jgi:ribosomal protein S17
MEENASQTKTATVNVVTEQKAKPIYSKRWKQLQKFERRTSKCAQRLADAVTLGVNVWMEQRDESASKRKDGGLKDGRKNFRKALRKSIRKASKAPADLLEAITRTGLPSGLDIGRKWI